MRLKFPNLPDLGRMAVAVKNVRWRDPLVQVWGLIGVVLVTGIVVHYARRPRGGEQKNASWETELLPGCPAAGTWRPEVCFSGEGEAMPSAPAAPLDLRGCADTAAGLKTWRFLTAGIRREIASLGQPAREITVTWSGTRGGNARALDLYFESVRDDADAAPGDFVIGNGLRSGDGTVETLHRWSRSAGDHSPELRICLVGDGTRPTPAQLAALGELITAIEARCGRVSLSINSVGDFSAAAATKPGRFQKSPAAA